MRIRKIVALGLAAGVVVGSFGVAEAAKKKKKPKPAAPVQVEQTFFLRRDDCGGDNDNARLSLVDGPDEAGNLCGWLNSGLINEVEMTSGQGEPTSDEWPVSDGLPLVLDASKPIKGTLIMKSSHLGSPAPETGVAAGQVEMIVDVTGVAGGEDVAVGSVTVEYIVAPPGVTYEVPFEIKPDAALDKKSFEALVMTTTIRGANVLHGLYELDDPPSTVVIPSWK